jgi:hypothetical protein
VGNVVIGALKSIDHVAEHRIGLPARTRLSMAFVMPPPRTMSALAISMMASVAGSIPVVSVSMTRIRGVSAS